MVCFCVTHISASERMQKKGKKKERKKERKKKKRKKRKKERKEERKKERKKERGYEHNGCVIYVKQWDNFWPAYLFIGK